MEVLRRIAQSTDVASNQTPNPSIEWRSIDHPDLEGASTIEANEGRGRVVRMRPGVGFFDSLVLH